MDNKDFVSEEVCAERHTNANEKFDGIQSDLKDKEERTRRIESLIITMGEIQKNHDAKIENHDKRIGALESKPGKSWEKFKDILIGALTTGLITAVLAFVFK